MYLFLTAACRYPPAPVFGQWIGGCLARPCLDLPVCFTVGQLLCLNE